MSMGRTWVTFNAIILTHALESFIAYTMVHTCLVAQLRIKALDTHSIARACSTFILGPFIVLFVGHNYFFTYAYLSR